jgi:hypothetical protein
MRESWAAKRDHRRAQTRESNVEVQEATTLATAQKRQAHCQERKATRDALFAAKQAGDAKLVEEVSTSTVCLFV